MTNATATASLHMIQVELDAKGLTTLGRMLGLPLRQTDTNYLVHCALGELFQDQAPKPYSIENDGAPGRQVRVLGYTDVDDETLQSLAQGFASPTVYQIGQWERLASKPMPDTFPEGMRLGFELRACPVIRKSSAGSGTNKKGQERTWKAGQELDVFLAQQWTSDESLDRESVYVEWLQRQFSTRGGAKLIDAGVDRFSIERMVRRTQTNANGDRTAHTVKRPDVTLSGTLTVTDSDAFQALLRSGIGRHKSFGFGMLKVRRAR